MIRYASGVLPITWHNGVLLFLVGKDVRDSSFSDFGGKCERYDRGPVATACREMYEETCGMILGIKQLHARLTPRTAVMLKSSTQNNYSYFCYVTEIPYMPHARGAFAKVLDFLRSRNVHRLYVEKLDLQWVTLEMLMAMPKRSVFAETLQAHMPFFEMLSGSPASAWKDICARRAHTFDAILHPPVHQ